MTDSRQRIAIIGGGPGGYVAAIRAAQLGAQVSLIEKDQLGGTCLNRGCVPTKYLIHATSIFRQAQLAHNFGIKISELSVDFPEMMKRKQAVIRQLQSGIEYLMDKNKIKVYQGTGTIFRPGKIRVTGETETLIEVDKIIIATGSEPASLPIEGASGKGVIFNSEGLELQLPPSSLIIIGGGVIGIEFAQIFQRLNTKVAIIEMMPNILPNEDIEITDVLAEELQAGGTGIYTGARVLNIGDTRGKKKTVTFETQNGSQELTAKIILMAVGRRPFIQDSGVTELGIASGKNGKIYVNNYLETNVPGIYAVGDVLGGSMLAHVAMAEGVCAAENAMGMTKEMNYNVIPRCVYASPEVAAVGLTEAEAKAKYSNIKVGNFPLVGNSKAVIIGETTGMVKIIAEAKYNQLLGVSIIGPHATELIAEAALAIKLEVTLDELIATIHAHPTLSEAIMEAGLNGEGRGIHY